MRVFKKLRSLQLHSLVQLIKYDSFPRQTFFFASIVVYIFFFNLSEKIITLIIKITNEHPQSRDDSIILIIF